VKPAVPNKIIARDISWLAFNQRVLQEALDDSNPLIERLRFLGIYSSNMDEFFRVRYASIKRLTQITAKSQERMGNKTPAEVLEEISAKVIEMQAQAQEVNDLLLAKLPAENIEFVTEKQLTEGQKNFVRKFFIDKVSPTVFTLMLNDTNKIPELRDKSIYLAIRMYKKGSDKNDFALIEVPADIVGRFVVLPKYGKQYVMYLEDVIRYNLEYILFVLDFDEIEAHTIKITRDAELDLDDDVSKSFLQKMTKSLKNRRVGDPVRFVYDKAISSEMLRYIIQRMDLDSYDSLIPGGRYHNKKDYIKFPNIGEEQLEFEPLPVLNHPSLDMDRSILDVLSKQDVLLFMPYHNFSYIIRLLRESAIDPNVTAISATLYRLADQSRIISALVNAAKNGKEVTVVIELRARFDEEANIKWTEKLQTEGVQVIFGVPGLKVHSKLIAISRKNNEGKIINYASIGTGNLNESTARFYTDYHLLTSDSRITKDVMRVFKFLQKNYDVPKYKHLLVSPHYTRKSVIKLIDKEIEFAKRGSAAGICLKLNSLSDVKLIEKLYEASSYGVKIKLVIRGICSLIPGVKNLSENIEAISILDRFLEHSRLLICENGGDSKVFIGSADWMPRNLDYRVEVTTPIYDAKIKRQIRDHFNIIWKDNVKSRWHNQELNNQYRMLKGPKIRSQYALQDYVKKQLKYNT
jgi:polyphosphate kinase